jgi:hypothetical protein
MSIHTGSHLSHFDHTGVRLEKLLTHVQVRANDGGNRAS